MRCLCRLDQAVTVAPTMANVNVELGQAVARSPALERRLRKRRQEARLRMRLAADAALLAGHHASATPGTLLSELVLVPRSDLAALREDIAVLQAQVRRLQAGQVQPSLAEASSGAEPFSEPVPLAMQAEKDFLGAELEKADKGQDGEDVVGKADAFLASQPHYISAAGMEVDALQRELIDSITRTGDLQGVLEEPLDSERGRRAIEQIIAELHEKSVKLSVELSKRGISVDESSFPDLNAEDT